MGLIVADIQNPFFAMVTRAVEDVAQANDYSVLLCNTDEDPDKERTYLELMRNGNAAGVILAPTGRLSRQFPPQIASAMPLVIIDRRVTGASLDSVGIDNVAAATALTRHMLEHGYTRIAGLFGAISSTGRERREGFLAALKEAGVSAPKELVLSLPAKEPAGYEATQRLLDLSRPPQALITSNGLLATGACKAIRDRGVPMPEGIAFATIDETLWTSMLRPAVTVVAQPAYAIGQTACEMLLKRIAESSRPTRQVVLASDLVIRESCGPHGPGTPRDVAVVAHPEPSRR
ncbi:substrate-binding domain-containing protein [Solidesulfovibrio fructosivorans]|uniref:substrate-binding domain-containing protein n=1 Tax=Solidesulfovibrio fructosivorans TaxID=878 RepID=UPI002351A072|nr:substrate-binding domain-containing protein [Solidesulfovibrio fructosivorans]